jgi:hypothetical protein
LLANAKDVRMSARPIILPEDPFPPLETLVTNDAMMATGAGVLRAHRASTYGLHGRLRQLAHTQQLITETQLLLGQTRSRLDRAAADAAPLGKA